MRSFFYGIGLYVIVATPLIFMPPVAPTYAFFVIGLLTGLLGPTIERWIHG